MPLVYTARDICRAINSLDKNITYSYVNPDNHGEIQIINVGLPEGPITIKRRKVGESWGNLENMSSQMIWRLANALNSGLPVNVDRVYAGSYNTRSVLEALLAHTPDIFICTPGRQESIGNVVKIKTGHKHIIYCRDRQHPLGMMERLDLGEDSIINEVPSRDMMYDIAPPTERPEILDPHIRRRHSQIQVCLAKIAEALGMRTWIAVEDQSIQYNGKRILEYPFIVKDLKYEPTISNFHQAIKVAKHIDCMCFNGGLPFAFEVEHTTGVTSGLDRMLRFKNAAPHLNTSCVIVAPDEDRHLVIERASPAQYQAITPMYFPYSQVEDLYGFIMRRSNGLRGVSHDFLRCMMEPCVAA